MGSFQKTRAREGLISVEEAQARVLAEVTPLAAEEIALPDALGRVLREDITAPRDVPPADNSAMDGYAVRSADTAGAAESSPARLKVVGDVGADVEPAVAVVRGTAVRIMTGGAIPSGADAVVQVEQTDAGDEIVQIYREASTGTNIRRRGDDMRAGDVVLRAGMPIRAGELGVLATIERRTVLAGKSPTVAIMSTGDEIVSGRVPNSNAHALAALARDCGCAIRVRPPVADDRDATLAALREALQSDVVVSSGGVSAGAYDFVKDALEDLGAETKFWQVAMKPGKPVVFSRVGERFVFGLPGNPVSCIVGFLLFVAPALRKLMGQTANTTLPRVDARAAVPFASRGDRRMYFRVQVVANDGALVAHPARAQGSGISTSMIGANGLAWLEAGATEVEAGATLPVLLFGPLLSEVWPTAR